MSDRHSASPRSTLARRARSVTGSGLLLARRRAREDVWLLLALVGFVALSAVLAVSGPRTVTSTIDGGVQDAVRGAGPSATLAFETVVGRPSATTTPTVTSAQGFAEFAEALPALLPPALGTVAGDTTATLVGPPTPLLARDDVLDRATDADGQVELRVAALPRDAAGTVGLDLVAGALPGDGGGDELAPVEVVVSTAVAERLGLGVGTRVAVAAPKGAVVVDGRPASELVVVGLVAPADATAPAWEAVPEVWEPTHREARSDRAAFSRATVLAAPAGVSRVLDAGALFTGTARFEVVPEAFTVPLAEDVVEAIADVRADGSGLSGSGGVSVTVRTALDDVLAAYPPQARAALAQMSVMTWGVVGVAAVVLVLLARLLVVRRGGVLRLERARGASAAAVCLRLLAEALVLTGLGVALGLGAAWLLTPGRPTDLAPLVVVAVVSLLAGPVQAAWLVRRAWTGRREPANRQDRAQLAKRRRVRRVVAEGAVVVLAGAAVVSLRGRGLLQEDSAGADPFLAAGPVLVAVAVTLLVLRVYPWPVRAAATLGGRTRGVLGVLGAVRAQRAVAPLPLLALTLGIGIAIAGGLLLGTVRGGQVEASWDRVGADVRVDGREVAVPLDQVTRVRAEAGTTGDGPTVASAEVTSGASLSLGTSSAAVTVLAVDEGYPDLLLALQAARGQDDPAALDVARSQAAALRDLRGSASTAGRVPVLVSPELAERVVGDDTALYVGASYVTVEVVGTIVGATEGYLAGPYVYADLEAVAAHAELAPTADTVWFVGEGSAQAATALDVPPETVQQRAQWLEARRDGALLAGVERLMAYAVAAIAVLGVVALVATVLAGARERGRALAMLRTLGMRPRLGWWLALAELAPVVVAALVGGTLSAVTIVLVLAPALGLDVLSGGVRAPDPAVDPQVIMGVAAAAAVLLLVAVLAEVLAHRRDRLSEVLRVGDTA
ncbi:MULTISPECIES: FtsX-like permease family protein [unclassified Actinotalea]|uniref:FtsX-like permease family protein n=1 Tax=unclassified Actinotalea TaxID=2638618 RepID=UPI0015F4C8D8|nr:MULTISPECIES: FtsX-like permease family protein [unclassified Actinotalea]